MTLLRRVAAISVNRPKPTLLQNSFCGIEMFLRNRLSFDEEACCISWNASDSVMSEAAPSLNNLTAQHHYDLFPDSGCLTPPCACQLLNDSWMIGREKKSATGKISCSSGVILFLVVI